MKPLSKENLKNAPQRYTLQAEPSYFFIGAFAKRITPLKRIPYQMHTTRNQTLEVQTLEEQKSMRPQNSLPLKSAALRQL